MQEKEIRFSEYKNEKFCFVDQFESEFDNDSAI